MPHLLRIFAVLTLPLLASLLAVAHAEDPAPPTAPAAPTLPTAPTCAKKVSKQVMSGGVVKTVMVDNGTCLKEWEAYSEAFGGWPPGGDAASPTLGTMKWIPAGTFTMGSPASEAGRDRYESQYETTLTRGFWLMEHEVTQGEWQAVMRSNPSSFPSCGPTCPVEKVSWHEAVWFAKLASARDGVAYRLPTDSEWEIAARGGQSYVYAGSNKATSVGWIWDNSGSTTHAVCQKARNGYGLCDMTGNVQEWITWNGISEYRRVRGGSWSGALWNTRVAYGNSGGPQSKQDDLGFRLARTSP